MNFISSQVILYSQYAESDNCMMELRFGVINMDLPMVAAIVGTQSGWKQTEVLAVFGTELHMLL